MNYRYEDFKHGQPFKARIHGEPAEGKISINEGDGRIFLCQNTKNGSPADNKLGFPYSWVLIVPGDDFTEGRNNVTDLVLEGKFGTDAPSDSPEGMKWGVRWDRKSAPDPVRFFKTKKAADKFIQGLMDNNDVRHDSVWRFKISDVGQAERVVTFKI